VALCSLLHLHRPLPPRRGSCSCHPRLPQPSGRNRLHPKFSKTKLQSLLESGYAYKIPELRIKKRESQGLPPLPKGNPENVKKTLKGVKFIDKIQKPQEKNQVGSKYLIFLGCAIPYRVSSFEISSRKVLAKLGVELVEMPEFNCCGLPLDPVSHETMLILAAKNLALAEQQGLNILTLMPRLRRTL
jgi:Fe-S oxidoreductase